MSDDFIEDRAPRAAPVVRRLETMTRTQDEKDLVAPAQERLRVYEARVGDVGGCNACARERSSVVYVIETRSLVMRLCPYHFNALDTTPRLPSQRTPSKPRGKKGKKRA